MKSGQGKLNGYTMPDAAGSGFTGKLPMHMARSKHGTYFELSDETLVLIDRIKSTTGLPKNRVVELAIRELAKDRTVYRQLSIDEFLHSKKPKKTSA